ncbi:hypothetical protein V6N12_069104 [Hibiscus sabdariffa]|uniref:Uncharacterized protein n=1 Tax=Hibiscus sabdariffa TaxID=183260 RepID=A0ABR2FD07_9ROSI
MPWWHWFDSLAWNPYHLVRCSNAWGAYHIIMVVEYRNPNAPELVLRYLYKGMCTSDYVSEYIRHVEGLSDLSMVRKIARRLSELESPDG